MTDLAALRDAPWYRLTRQFLGALFDLGFLSDAAAESFRRMILGIGGVFAGAGLMLVRVFMVKYVNLAAQHSADPYHRAVIADHAFLIAMPMWIVALVTVLVGHALFPDETDYRVLMSLPVSRRLVFGAKLCAVGLFTGLFVAGVQVALAPMFLLTSVNRWAAEPFWLRVVAYGTATLLASTFAMLLVTAIHAVMLLAVPRGRLMTASAAVRCALVCGLVLSLPLVGRLLLSARAIADNAWWLPLAPPVWFVGLERLWIGDTQTPVTHVASIAVWAMITVVSVVTAGYTVLYRRFDRVLHRPADARAGMSWKPFRFGRGAVGPVVLARAAVRSFTAITLTRSVLHQGALVAFAAIAAGLVLNSFLIAGVWPWLQQGDPAPARIISAIVRAPFVLMFVTCLAARMAVSLPIELRANWIFRVTEAAASRAAQVDAAASVIVIVGVVAPVMVIFPLLWLALGPPSILVAFITLSAGAIFVEVLLRQWAQIPFTCSFMPGKGFVPQTVMVGLFSFALFRAFGTDAALLGAARPAVGSGLAVTLIAITGILRVRRRRAVMQAPLLFEDQLPTEINPLRLRAD